MIWRKENSWKIVGGGGGMDGWFGDFGQLSCIRMFSSLLSKASPMPHHAPPNCPMGGAGVGSKGCQNDDVTLLQNAKIYFSCNVEIPMKGASRSIFGDFVSEKV